MAFDADDTLWDCQSHFEQVEEHLYRLIAPYCENPKQELFHTESGHMADFSRILKVARTIADLAGS